MSDNGFVVEASNIKFAYESDDAVKYVLKDVSLNLKRGSYVSLLGRNGSGKSTFSKLVDVLELPEDGQIKVFGIVTSDESRYMDIRRRTGCVFQNPDNQIVGTTVEEDVAFGPENLGVPNPELRERVDSALKYVGLYDLRNRQTANLSGGQKQKLAIAGILAMKPELLLLDEATAMLDPVSREEFLTLVERLIKDENITVLTITHDMSEADRTDYVYIMENGRIIDQGKPQDVLTNVPKIKECGLDAPIYSKLVYRLSTLTNTPYEEDEIKSFDGMLRYVTKNYNPRDIKLINERKDQENKVFSVSNITYCYDKDLCALNNVSLDVYKGELLAIVGRSGCGKTTLISHFNGIIRPEGEGNVEFFDGEKVYTTRKKGDIKMIRQKVGLVFQYPEYQLFEETVYKDICYGPMKMGMPEDEMKKSVLAAVEAVGLDDSVLDKSPFELSGGQQRRVAMAGVLAMKPEVLVLDEPAAGLDPAGRKDMFDMIRNLKKKGTTIILVTHNMDEAYANSDRICVIKSGSLMTVSNPQELFEDKAKLEEMEIAIPPLVDMLEKISDALKLSDEDRRKLLRATNVSEAAMLIGGQDA